MKKLWILSFWCILSYQSYSQKEVKPILNQEESSEQKMINAIKKGKVLFCRIELLTERNDTNFYIKNIEIPLSKDINFDGVYIESSVFYNESKQAQKDIHCELLIINDKNGRVWEFTKDILDKLPELAKYLDKKLQETKEKEYNKFVPLDWLLSTSQFSEEFFLFELLLWFCKLSMVLYKKQIMEKIIGIDLDEVLSETVDGVLKFHNYQINGIPAHKEDISDYYIFNIQKYNLNKEDAITYFRVFLDEAQKSEDIFPVPWAKEWLERLKNNWWKIIIVTARRTEIQEFTIHRLNEHFLWLWDEILFANHFSANEVTKSELCKQHGIHIMVEDNLDYAIDLANAGVKTYLLDKPWNQKYEKGIYPDIIKVYWRDEIHI